MSLNTKIWRKFTKSPARNLGLQVGEKIFWVSRRRLADLSPVFEAMLFGDFQEATKEIIELSDKDPGDILEMLRCLFPTAGQGYTTKPIDDGNVDILLQLADEYQIKDLVGKCSMFLSREMAEKSTKLLEFIVLANQYHLKDVVRIGLRTLSTYDPSKMLKNPAFTGLPMNMRQAVSMIAWFRGSRPRPAHEYVGSEDYEEWPDDWSRDWDEEEVHECGSRCKFCDYQKCNSGYCDEYRLAVGDDTPDCEPICHTCNKRYGNTDFVCDCVDPDIKIELEKLGL